MPFLTRLAALEPDETWPGMEQAAEQRYWDGLVLATDAGHEAGAIYLLGYVAEILLKTACFRTAGVGPQDNLWARQGAFDQVKTFASWTGRNLHDLTGWLQFLIDVRQAIGKPLNPVTAGLITASVLAVNAHWREFLRYRFSAATEAELNETADGVDWLRLNYDLLWR
ncbi:MAG: hypothetical protein JO250_12135 [Armatimonadetes bacterium]|nr:hypothetical protein [Armatimonadota bacterium]